MKKKKKNILDINSEEKKSIKKTLNNDVIKTPNKKTRSTRKNNKKQIISSDNKDEPKKELIYPPWESNFVNSLRPILNFPNEKINPKNPINCNLFNSYVCDQDNNNFNKFLEDRKLHFPPIGNIEDIINDLNLKKITKINNIEKEYIDCDEEKNKEKNKKINKIDNDHEEQVKYTKGSIKSYKYRIILNETQKNIILNWIKICDNFYNFCVTKHQKQNIKKINNVNNIDNANNVNNIDNANNVNNIDNANNVNNIDNVHNIDNVNNVNNVNNIDNINNKKHEEYNFNKGCIAIKTHVFRDYFEVYLKENYQKYENIIFTKLNYKNYDNEINKEHIYDFDNMLKNKPLPYDILTDVLSEYCNSLKSNYTKIKKKIIKHFKIKEKQENRNYKTIHIPKTAIKENGFFTSILGPIKKFNKKLIEVIKKNKLVHDCKLSYDAISDTFYLHVPQYVEHKEKIENKEKYAAIDPGVNVFASFFAEKSYGHLGINMKKKILKYRTKIDNLKSILKKKKKK